MKSAVAVMAALCAMLPIGMAGAAAPTVNVLKVAPAPGRVIAPAARDGRGNAVVDQGHARTATDRAEKIVVPGKVIAPAARDGRGNAVVDQAHARTATYRAEKIVVPGKVIAPVALNDQGQALMQSSRCADCDRRYFVWSAGTATAIQTPAGASYFEAIGLGPDETFAVVAQYGTNPQPETRSFVGQVSGGKVSYRALLDPQGDADGVEAESMDPRGDILGQATGAPATYLLWPPGQSTAQALNLSPPDPGDQVTVTALDGAGDFAGVASTNTGEESLIWPGGGAPLVLPGSFVAWDTQAGAPVVSGLTAGAGGTIYITGYQSPVSYVRTKCALWTATRAESGNLASVGRPQYIKPIGGSDPGVQTGGVSQAGTVVGASWSPSRTQPLVFRAGTEKVLRSLIVGTKPPVSSFSGVPAGINAKGQVLVGDWLLTP